jgi:hypothetical protein
MVYVFVDWLQLGFEAKYRKFGKEWCNQHAIHGQYWL